ncbi:hypothetical protein DPMN_042325 [Dreissena polymorpha]|uniref:Uncharacterized protein n=1 Tax=Dreissena polymorpha TaxID=45954 RepID=A0A9D4CYV8_DREPO|nr:hypothetical protein DPMN_042325 [Dreissena polymorpha]
MIIIHVLSKFHHDKIKNMTSRVLNMFHYSRIRTIFKLNRETIRTHTNLLTMIQSFKRGFIPFKNSGFTQSTFKQRWVWVFIRLLLSRCSNSSMLCQAFFH